MSARRRDSVPAPFQRVPLAGGGVVELGLALRFGEEGHLVAVAGVVPPAPYGREVTEALRLLTAVSGHLVAGRGVAALLRQAEAQVALLELLLALEERHAPPPRDRAA